jgi:hypothetical protein
VQHHHRDDDAGDDLEDKHGGWALGPLGRRHSVSGLDGTLRVMALARGRSLSAWACWIISPSSPSMAADCDLLRRAGSDRAATLYVSRLGGRPDPSRPSPLWTVCRRFSSASFILAFHGPLKGSGHQVRGDTLAPPSSSGIRWCSATCGASITGTA